VSAIRTIEIVWPAQFLNEVEAVLLSIEALIEFNCVFGNLHGERTFGVQTQRLDFIVKIPQNRNADFVPD
jgi:hypothetical protein